MITKSRLSRKKRIRSRISGDAVCPRLAVFRSNKFIYAQLIDDVKGKTLAASVSQDPKEVGTTIAKLAKDKKVKKIVFDRGGYRYHGQVQALAEAARAAGLVF